MSQLLFSMDLRPFRPTRSGQGQGFSIGRGVLPLSSGHWSTLQGGARLQQSLQRVANWVRLRCPMKSYRTNSEIHEAKFDWQGIELPDPVARNRKYCS